LKIYLLILRPFFIALYYFSSVPCFSYRSNLFAPFSF